MGISIHLIIKRNDQTASELMFDSTPIYIGRKVGVQVLLADMAVSREHAIIDVREGKWSIEDLDSANKTYLNGAAIHKAAIKTGDILKIADFSIEIVFEDTADKNDEPQVSASDDTVSMEATDTESASLSTPRDEVIVRKPDGAHAPAMRLAARRLTDFAQAAEAIGEAKDLDEMVQVLLKTSLQQFTAFRVWCGIRSQKTGPVTYQAGKRRDGKSVEFKDLRLNDKITEALERGQSMVFPQVAAKLEASERIRSAMIASIKSPKGSFGVLYIDNAMVHGHYSLSDLDYLMVLAMHVAAILKNFL
ncbi:MAG: FHA domain-containing protein [Phycisphaerae bacterium]|nr:FHA domain-containing protein [Phycisphaerae bacterium]